MEGRKEGQMILKALLKNVQDGIGINKVVNSIGNSPISEHVLA